MMAKNTVWISVLIFQEFFVFGVVLGKPNIIAIDCCGPWTPILADENVIESEAMMNWDYTNRLDAVQHMDRSTYQRDYYLDDLGPQLYMSEEPFVKSYKKSHV